MTDSPLQLHAFLSAPPFASNSSKELSIFTGDISSCFLLTLKSHAVLCPTPRPIETVLVKLTVDFHVTKFNGQFSALSLLNLSLPWTQWRQWMFLETASSVDSSGRLLFPPTSLATHSQAFVDYILLKSPGFRTRISFPL